MRGRKRSNRGKVTQRGKGGGLKPGQRTLMDYLAPKEIKERPPSPPKKELTQEEQEPNAFAEMESKLIDYVKKHQLNEILITFQLADRLLIPFSPVDMKHFYEVVQKEMIDEFGAPLSPSLFSKLFDEEQKDETSCSQIHETQDSLF